MGNLKEIKMSIQEREQYILNVVRNVIGQTGLLRHEYREEMRSVERFAVAVLPTIFRWVEKNVGSDETIGKILRCAIGRNRVTYRGQILRTPWAHVEIWD